MKRRRRCALLSALTVATALGPSHGRQVPPPPPPPRGTGAPQDHPMPSYSGLGRPFALQEPGGGACGLLDWPRFAELRYAAVGPSQWNGSRACGRCAAVWRDSPRGNNSNTTTSTTNHGIRNATDNPPSKAVVVYLVDQCRDCHHGDLRLSPATFRDLNGDIVAGGNRVRWRLTDCPFASPEPAARTRRRRYADGTSGDVPKLCINPGSTAHWLALQPVNDAFGITEVTVNGRSARLVGDSFYYSIEDPGGRLDLSRLALSLHTRHGWTLRRVVSFRRHLPCVAIDRFARVDSTGGSDGVGSSSSSASLSSSNDSAASSSSSPPTATSPTPSPSSVTEEPARTRPILHDTTPTIAPPTSPPASSEPPAAPLAPTPSLTPSPGPATDQVVVSTPLPSDVANNDPESPTRSRPTAEPSPPLPRDQHRETPATPPSHSSRPTPSASGASANGRGGGRGGGSWRVDEGYPLPWNQQEDAGPSGRQRAIGPPDTGASGRGDRGPSGPRRPRGPSLLTSPVFIGSVMGSVGLLGALVTYRAKRQRQRRPRGPMPTATTPGLTPMTIATATAAAASAAFGYNATPSSPPTRMSLELASL